MDRILIPGLRELGTHGVLASEQEQAQPFEVDIELFVDTSRAGASDELTDTVDYAVVCEAVRRVIVTEHHQLLERLAARIAEVCKADPRVERVAVEVRKLRPLVTAQVRHIAVRIER